MLKLMLLIIILSQVNSQCQDDQNYQEYLKWKAAFNAKYDKGEDVFRAFIFKQHKKMIKKNNLNPNSQHKQGQTQFMGISKGQFIATYLGAIPPDYNFAGVELTDDDSQTGTVDIKANAIAASIDWRQTGAVTSVKGQGACGSCWAFSSVGALESSYLIKNKVQLDLSQQQLVSCSQIFGPQGCNGGWPVNALKYPLNYGITTEAAYPYVGKTGTCLHNGGKFKIKKITVTANGKCGSIRNQLQLRPVSVTVDASDWAYYKSGVFKCSPGEMSINHAVLLVGYDENKNWIIKNSWSTSWGEQGYMTIKSSNKYNCGICIFGAQGAVF